MKKFVIPIISTLALIGFDQATKFLARTYLPGNPVTLIDGVFELRYTENTGAAFGVFKGQQWLFYLITILALALIVFVYIKFLQEPKFSSLRVLAIFIFAGAAGNFIDRIINGYVVDFMYISLIDFPVFNVADLYVSWCAVIALILLLFKYKESDFKTKKDGSK